MCGIFGWLTPGKQTDRGRTYLAVSQQRHRGPDDEGYVLADLASGRCVPAGGPDTPSSLNLPSLEAAELPTADGVLGFRRLSIHDLSPAGHQPMSSAEGKLWIAFNGEVYNFVELRAELEGFGYTFQTGSDTEVVLRAYQHWGEACFPRFNGMWAIALLDLRTTGQPKLTLVRDRCGVKPLFYTIRDQSIAFASELKSLLKLPGDKQPDAVAVSNFLAWNRLPNQREGHTFIKDHPILPPGAMLHWTPQGVRLERWWDLPAAPTEELLPEEEAVSRLRELLTDAVRLRLRADVKVGSCLSGGVDSSIIVGMAHDMLKAQGEQALQHTVSAVYHEAGPFNEIEHIEKVLKPLEANGLYTYPDAQNLVEEFDKLVWHQEEPFPSTSIYAQWCVMRLAKESGVTVLLDGQAADELFAGYRPYQTHFQEESAGFRWWNALRSFGSIRAETGETPWKPLLAGLALSSVPKKLATTLVKARYLQELKNAGKYLKPDVQRDLLERVRDPESAESYPWRRVGDSLDSHLRGLVSHFVLPTLLRYEDRNSMAWSIEARVPFTDYRVVEFAFSQSLAKLKIMKGWSKWCLRKAGEGYAPKDILWRKDKMGFGTPEQLWMQSLIKAKAAEVLAGSPVEAYIEGSLLGELLASDKLGNPKFAAQQLRILVVHSWLKQYFN